MSVHAIGAARPTGEFASPSAAGSSGAGAFRGMVEDLLGNEAAASAKADQAIQAMATGQVEDMHKVTLAVAQADLQFRLVLELRNRLTEAFQEVARMQV
jgi:flagellar hook-basal body complex protein FliE